MPIPGFLRRLTSLYRPSPGEGFWKRAFKLFIWVVTITAINVLWGILMATGPITWPVILPFILEGIAESLIFGLIAEMFGPEKAQEVHAEMEEDRRIAQEKQAGTMNQQISVHKPNELPTEKE